MPPVFSGYKVVEKIAEGGSSLIWRAEKPGKTGSFAIKQLKPTLGADDVKSFRTEMKLLAELKHEGLLRLFDTNFEAIPPYAILEYFPGENLKTLLRTKDERLPRMWRDIAVNVTETLLYLHLNSIVHKDVKPENILLAKNGDTKLIDLSIAEKKSFLSSFGKKKIQGTPAYMAPEQIQGKPVDHRADIYSLGATLYEIVTGKPLFIGRSQDELLRKHLQEKPKPLRSIRPETPEALDRLIQKMLAKDPAMRIQDGNLILFELKRIPAPGPAAAEPDDSSRRGSTRIVVRSATCSYVVVAGDDAPFQDPSANRCVMSNLGRTGIGFFSREPIPTDAVVDLVLHLPPLRAPLHVRGRVLWANRIQGEDSFSVGVRMTVFPEEYDERFDELKKFHATVS